MFLFRKEANTILPGCFLSKCVHSHQTSGVSFLCPSNDNQRHYTLDLFVCLSACLSVKQVYVINFPTTDDGLV